MLQPLARGPTCGIWVGGQTSSDAECAAVADAHLDVLDAVAPVLPALRGAPQAVAPRLGARSKAALTVAALALIAAAAALVLGAPAAPVPAPDTSSVALLAPDDLDARLDDVHDDVVAASLDVGPL